MDVSGHGEDAEGPHLVAPKISLLVAVASHLKISRVHYRRATGGCAKSAASARHAAGPNASPSWMRTCRGMSGMSEATSGCLNAVAVASASATSAGDARRMWHH